MSTTATQQTVIGTRHIVMVQALLTRGGPCLEIKLIDGTEIRVFGATGPSGADPLNYIHRQISREKAINLLELAPKRYTVTTPKQ